ncbi:hypothetical protein GmHk_19G054344 [Glycine max]|nr:hypothetical protein GmHk_19G054344 [Glycine max]
MKVEQLFACHHISEERKVTLATLSFQVYALYWWTSLIRERRLHRDPLVEYWNDLKSALKKRHIPSYYEKELMDKIQRLRQVSMSVEEYRQQMELLLLRAGLRVEERTSIATFLSGLNMEVRDKVELLPYRDLEELVRLGDLLVRKEHVPLIPSLHDDTKMCNLQEIVYKSSGHTLLVEFSTS